MENISYERRVYESVDDKSLSWNISENGRKRELMQQRVITIIASIILYHRLQNKCYPQKISDCYKACSEGNLK